MSKASETAEPKVGLLEQALAEEIRVEIARQRVTLKEMYARTGLSATVYRRTFVDLEVSPPLYRIGRVAEALGLTPDELLRRAQDNLKAKQREAQDPA